MSYASQWIQKLKPHTRKDRKLVINEDEAPIRRKAYEMFLQYRRKGTVAKLLNAGGHRTRNKTLFSDTQITRILTCSSAKGLYYFNRIPKTGSWAGTEKPEEEWGKVACSPIVPEALWNQVNQIIEESLKQWKKPGKVPVNPFGNRIWCQCGGKMYERKHTGKFHCRACNRKVSVEDLEQLMREELHQFYGSPEQVAARLTDARKNLEENETALAALQRQIQKVREEMKQTHQLFLDGQITPQGFGEFYKPAEERLNQLLGGLPRLEADVNRLKVNQIEPASIHGDDDGIALPPSRIVLHRTPPTSCCTSAAVRCSGSMSGLSNVCTRTKQNLDRRHAMSSRPAWPASFSSSTTMT
jgi:site-specific DNA recombinase